MHSSFGGLCLHRPVPSYSTKYSIDSSLTVCNKSGYPLSSASLNLQARVREAGLDPAILAQILPCEVVATSNEVDQFAANAELYGAVFSRYSDKKAFLDGRAREAAAAGAGAGREDLEALRLRVRALELEAELVRSGGRRMGK